MLANDYGLSVPPYEEHGVDQVQVLIHVLLRRQIKQDVVGFCMQDVHMPWGRGQEGGQGRLGVGGAEGTEGVRQEPQEAP
jgi:hypothetical protein